MNKLSKRAISIIVIATFLISMIPIMPASAATITVGPSGTYATIQAAITAAGPGDIITVAAGLYIEDLIIPVGKDGLELSGATGAIIKGVNSHAGPNWGPLGEENIRVQSDDVKIHGFTIESPTTLIGDLSDGLVFEASGLEIYDNDFVFVGAGASLGIGSTSKAILPLTDIDGLSIHDNTFTGTTGQEWEGIYLCEDIGTGSVTIEDNTFSGNLHRAICTTRSKVTISGNTMTTTGIGVLEPVRGIDVCTSGAVTISGVVVTDNVIDGFDWGINFGDGGLANILSGVVAEGNIITDAVTGVSVRGADATGIAVNYNHILSGGVSNTAFAGTLDAENNYWGTLVESEILALTTGLVDFDPWALEVDKGDTLTISGSGVSSGSLVEAFWDTAAGSGAQLLNTTTGNPDGTYDMEIDVPSAVEGPHFIWVKDSLNPPVLHTTVIVIPKLSLSPTSGLVGDEITVKGYGFSAENDVTIIWDSGVTDVVKTTTVETDELGYVTYKFDVPTGTGYGDYWIDATDEEGYTATAKFTLGASITLTPDEGPTGTKVKVEGRGWTAGETISFAIGTTDVDVVDAKVVTVKSGGTFSADIIIPDMGSEGDYEVEASETDVIPPTGTVKGPSHDHFEIDGLPKIKVNPTYGTPGAIITVTGYNFTQIAGTIVTVTLDSIPESVLIDDAETKSDGTFEATFISPAVTFTTYDVTATDEYSIDADDAFKVGLIALILNPVSGESGTMVSLTGIGFANGDYNVTFASSDESYTKLYEDFGTVTGEAIADPFYVPNVDPGTYTLTISDTDDNELTSTYTVTESTYVIVKPALAPIKYNVSLKGYHFADAVADVDFIIYNVTSDGKIDREWDMLVQTSTGISTVDDTATDIDGNFTGWWKVDEDISNGDYTINVTGGKGLLVQLDFSVVSARVSVTPRKALFARGDTVSFDISNDFPIEGTIEIYDPNEILYWITDLLYDGVGETTDVWVLVEGLETVPYYSQTANANPMELASDAPLGTWTYFFYEGTKELMNSTFVVGASAAAQIDEMMDDVRSEISDLGDALAGITDDVEDDIAGLSDEIAGVASDLANLGEDIVGDLANDIAAATDAGQAALGAVEDLADSMQDLGDAVSDIADIASDSAEASQSAADAANDAVQAAQDAKDSASGLTTLVYGAIGASLIAALAAIVSLMQISKRIAG